MDDGLANKITSGLVWSFGERIFAQLTSLIVSVVLARFLLPEEYGVVSLIMVFITLANVFVANGFGESLIQKKDSNENDFSTIFWCSVSTSIILYLLIYFVAPYIAYFYNNHQLIAILRVLAIKIPISSISTIQHAYVSKHMMFKKFFFSTLGGTVVSGVIGIAMAIHGFGAWSLVAQYLINTAIDTIILFFTVQWKPKFYFSVQSFKELFGFSWKITAASFINTLYGQLRTLIIGKKYSTADLAFYNKGDQFPSLIITNLNTSISAVIFPALSSVNDNILRLKDISRRFIRMTSYIVFPALFGMICVAKPMIQVLLTEKWLPAVPFMQILCLYWITQPLQTASWQVIKAIGRGDLCLKLEFVKKGIGIILMIITMYISTYAMAWSLVFLGFVSTLIGVATNAKLIGYTISEQLKDIKNGLFLSGLMAFTVYLVGFIPLSMTVILILQLIVGVTTYIVTSIIFRVDEWKLLQSTMMGLIKHK